MRPRPGSGRAEGGSGNEVQEQLPRPGAGAARATRGSADCAGRAPRESQRSSTTAIASSCGSDFTTLRSRLYAERRSALEASRSVPTGVSIVRTGRAELEGGVQPVPPECPPWIAWVGRGDEEDDRDSLPPEDRPGLLGEIAVAVVEGDENRAKRQPGLSAADGEKLLEREQPGAARRESASAPRIGWPRADQAGVEKLRLDGVADAVVRENGQRIGSGAGRTVEHIDQPSEAPSARGRERRPPKQRLGPHARALRRSLAAILANSARLSRGSSRAKTSKPSFGYARRTAA